MELAAPRPPVEAGIDIGSCIARHVRALPAGQFLEDARSNQPGIDNSGGSVTTHCRPGRAGLFRCTKSSLVDDGQLTRPDIRFTLSIDCLLQMFLSYHSSILSNSVSYMSMETDHLRP